MFAGQHKRHRAFTGFSAAIRSKLKHPARAGSF